MRDKELLHTLLLPANQKVVGHSYKNSSANWKKYAKQIAQLRKLRGDDQSTRKHGS